MPIYLVDGVSTYKHVLYKRVCVLVLCAVPHGAQGGISWYGCEFCVQQCMRILCVCAHYAAMCFFGEHIYICT